MTTPTEAPAPRLRADAARNRARLVSEARAAFAEAEDGASVTMEAVAKRAGVGIGTLYRHFPTRTELMEAVYREHVDELQARADELRASRSPWDALAEWLMIFVSSASLKRAVFTELVATVGRDSDLITHSKASLRETVSELVAAAQQAGEVRDDVTAADVLSLVSGCTMMHLEGDQADRVMRVILSGLRP